MSETKTEVVRLRITPGLKAELAEAAKQDGRTMSNYIEWLIKRALESECAKQ